MCTVHSLWTVHINLDLMTIFDASSFKAIDDDTGSRNQVTIQFHSPVSS